MPSKHDIVSLLWNNHALTDVCIEHRNQDEVDVKDDNQTGEKIFTLCTLSSFRH